jgi:hypothetical protein
MTGASAVDLTCSSNWEFSSSPPRLDWLWGPNTSYPMGNGGSFSEGVELYLHTHTHTHTHTSSWYGA